MSAVKRVSLRRLSKRARRDVAGFWRLLDQSTDLIKVMQMTPRSRQ